ncbi:MAG: ATP-binding protein [Desulfococcaceae bacterium]
MTAKPDERGAADPTPADPRPLRVLARMAARKTVPHALLFVGPDGVGKSAAAIRAALALNCQADANPEARFEHPACQCRACRKIRAGVHPDFHRIAPDGPLIRIDRIRDLIGRMAMRPNEARRRIALIEGAGAMNPEAGNALLKLLEEPPDRTVLILTARQPSELLPTLVSRCRTFRFAPPPRPLRAREMEERLRIPRERALALAALDGAAPADSSAAERRLRRRDWVVSEVGRLISGDGPPGFELAFAERLAGDREGAAELLESALVWLRDALVVRHAGNQRLFPDRTDEPAGRLSAGSLLKLAAAVETARRRMQSNANARLALEVMSLEIAEISHEESRRHSVQAGRKSI